jgi:hypothetical protein
LSLGSILISTDLDEFRPKVALHIRGLMARATYGHLYDTTDLTKIIGVTVRVHHGGDGGVGTGSVTTTTTIIVAAVTRRSAPQREIMRH